MLTRSVHILIIGLLALPGLAAAAGAVRLPATNQTTCFDANGIQRNCAGTGEDGEKLVGVAWPIPRFDVKNDGTVKDKMTGLTWSRHANAPSRALPGAPNNGCQNAEKDMIWQNALDFIVCLNANKHAGSNDWRLPNLNELESMLNAGFAENSAYLNANGFGFGTGLPSQVQASQYWTSTSNANEPIVQIDPLTTNSLSAYSAWDIDLFRGDFPFSSGKNEHKRAVWPVRGTSTDQPQLWRTGQAVCFNDVGDTRPCTGTGEDGETLAAGAAWPAPRFRTNVNTTLALDRLTGLVWTTATLSPGPPPGPSPDPEGCNTGTNLYWQEALEHVACLNKKAYLGRGDWRLPNRNELRSLVDYSRGNPALPGGSLVFDDRDGLTYWSSTTNASAPKDAWAISMLDGSLSSAVKTGTLPVWPVSGPDLVAPALTITQGNMSTKVASQTIGGTVEAGATMTVSVNGGTPADVSPTGTIWSFTINPLATGVNNVTVSAADFSENKTTASISITLDTLAPALAINPVTTPTNNKSQTLSGTVEAGATVQVLVGTTPVPVTVDNIGTTWNAVIPNLVEGPNAISVTATDAVGNTTPPLVTTITLDTIPSVTTVTPNPGTYTDRVTVALATTEPGSTIHYTIDGTPVTNASPVYNGPITLAAAIANYRVQFFSVDTAGNVETLKSADYTMQDTKLTGSVKINNGAPQTNKSGVVLTLAASDPTGVPQMQVACDGVTFAAAEPFAATRSCALPSGDGTKAVAVKFIDGLGIVSPPVTASIMLDTTPPDASVTPIAGNYSGSVAVAMATTEAGSTIYYTTDGTPVTTASPVYSAPITLTATTTTSFNVRTMAVDKAGNAGPVTNVAYTIHVDAASVGIKINNGALYANNDTVTLALSATHSSGVNSMQFSNDGVSYSALEPYATSKTWTLSGGNGLKTVYVRFKDGTGTLSTISANISYSTTATGVSSCDLNGDKTVDIRDALKALQIAIGLYSPTLDEMIRGDVAPLVNGKPKPDGTINIADALVILQRSLGLVAIW